MSKNLVIVESPAKAKTIEKFLGSDYRVLSSQGHIRDIQPLGKNSLGIDLEHGYQPNYVVDPDKEHILSALRAESRKADTVWLASDADREGEAIAWHLYNVLDLSKKDTKRITFPEITRSAIQEAILSPRSIDMNLVNAQQARRVLDRIIGYELSPVLWRKVTTGLSAGRVQSVAVRLIVEREREIEEFHISSSYRVIAEFTGQNPGDASILRAELSHRFAHKADAQAFLESCARAKFKVLSVTTKPGHRSPAPPFTTSLLQQEASRKLHFPASKTMRLAQSLYEAGHITYMRTDSMNLSGLAIATAKEEIIKEYGEQYSHVRQYHTTSKGAQEAHEAIRPSYMSAHTAGSTPDEQRLYELIWKRTIACQMADADTSNTRIEVSMSGSEYTFVAQGEVVTFDGFMRAYVQSSDDESDEDAPRFLPRMAEGEGLRVGHMEATQVFTKPPQRYNDATLVRKMDELGIGRPSTYAAIIDTIIQHKYIERGSIAGTKRDYSVLTLHQGKVTERTKGEMYGADSQKFIPTDLGRITTSFLTEQFAQILDYGFTARNEENFDRIAAGELDWVKDVDTFYHTFHPMLAQVPAGKISGRVLGKDPKTGEPVIAKISKLGPCIQLGDSDTEKPKFASLKRGQSLYTITLQEALDLFEHQLPYTLCELDGEPLIVGDGKYGPYLKLGTLYASLPKTIDPFAVTPEEARDLIDRKRIEMQPVHQWGDICVMRGNYGPYIKTPQGNYRLPRKQDPAVLTEEEVRQNIATSEPIPVGGKSRFRARK